MAEEGLRIVIMEHKDKQYNSIRRVRTKIASANTEAIPVIEN